jgi:hypothetical protein
VDVRRGRGSKQTAERHLHEHGVGNDVKVDLRESGPGRCVGRRLARSIELRGIDDRNAKAPLAQTSTSIAIAHLTNVFIANPPPLKLVIRSIFFKSKIFISLLFPALIGESTCLFLLDSRSPIGVEDKFRWNDLFLVCLFDLKIINP